MMSYCETNLWNRKQLLLKSTDLSMLVPNPGAGFKRFFLHLKTSDVVIIQL